MSYRVIQWGTGNAGFHSLRALIRRPDFELVGLYAFSSEKVGKDAGEIAGIEERTGILATGDKDKILAMDADCVVYNAIGEPRFNEAIDDMCGILRSGKNLVGTSLINLIYPPFENQSSAKKLEEACKEGGTSLFINGIDPGFTGDLFPFTFMNLAERVDMVRVTEIFNYGTYDDDEFTGVYMGFGRPLDYEAIMLAPATLKWAWGPVMQMVADQLGIEIEKWETHEERVPAPETFETTMGRIEKGTCAGVHFQIRAMANGRAVIIAEHYNRLHDDIAPHWPKPPQGKSGCHRLKLEGSPTIEAEFQLEGWDGDHNTGGIIATAMRPINAIPAVVAAPPGCLSTRDMPVGTIGRLSYPAKPNPEFNIYQASK